MYQITLRDAPPASLATRFPAITWHSAPAATILSRRDADPADVDVLIERLRSVGITPLEIHASSRSYEFRIEGRLSDSTLRYMQWSARLDQERTVMRGAATPVARAGGRALPIRAALSRADYKAPPCWSI